MHQFDRDISLLRRLPGRFDGRVSGEWSINGNPNGGYLLAIAASAMLQEADKKSTPIITINYTSRPDVGEAEIEVNEFARSRQFHRMYAGLAQDGQQKFSAMGTFSEETEDCFIRRYEAGAPEIPLPEDCVQIPRMPKFTLYDHMDVRLDPACAGWMNNSLSDRSEHLGWIAFQEERSWDVCALCLAIDSFPPAVFATQGMIAWVPTIELTINIRNIPQTHWLKGHFRTRFINCGLVEEDGELWDENGELVAISRQIAQFRVSVA